MRKMRKREEGRERQGGMSLHVDAFLPTIKNVNELGKVSLR